MKKILEYLEHLYAPRGADTKYLFVDIMFFILASIFLLWLLGRFPLIVQFFNSTFINSSVVAVAAYFAYKIATKQTEINKKIFRLQSIPSIELFYNKEQQLELTNKSAFSIYFVGVKGHQIDDMKDPPHLLAPNSKPYKLAARELEQKVLTESSNTTTEYPINIDFYINTIDGERFLIPATLNYHLKNKQVVAAYTQVLPAKQI